ncbi:MAG: hypothetical protein IJD92_02690 [Bacilli bacterium]|nr:hypothetical protein [Bacilli bacterium]
MQFIIAWISSIIATYLMKITFMGNLLKDLADNGYILNIERLSNLNILNEKQITTTKFIDLIPIYNMLNTMKLMYEYKYNNQNILDTLDIYNLVIELNEEDKNTYKLKPTGFIALLLTIKNMTEKNTITTINFKEEKSKIDFLYNEETDEIKIIKIKGPLKHKTNEELEEKIRKSLISMVQSVEEQYGSIENFINENKENLDNNRKIEIEKHDIKKDLEELKKLKKDLTNIKNNNYNNEQNDYNNNEEVIKKTKKLK